MFTKLDFEKLDTANQILAIQRLIACGHAMNDMGIIRDSQLGAMYELEVCQVIYQDDNQWDCPCCHPDYMDDDWYAGLFYGYDADYEDMYKKTNRDAARERACRNRYIGDTRDSLRGYKNRNPKFKR